ncbi:hypothetical protein [Brevundimonas viscosa]|uniref:Uncharacterized protein n=1 Tax=Brevundimonas viscosa TaxID=871741 RepID=A0A1I6NRG1_9CAUL|nr:hypothetical protein [Brevundimonas viscosa]SFS30507.1 hypothetical protein SAMN05192570_0396 [Brevundimonas viscosa]
MTQTPPGGPRRSPRFNSLVVLGLVLLFVAAGAFVWMRWSADAVTAADEAGEAMVQPAELPPPDAGAVPAEPGATGVGNAVAPEDERGLDPAPGAQPVER